MSAFEESEQNICTGDLLKPKYNRTLTLEKPSLILTPGRRTVKGVKCGVRDIARRRRLIGEKVRQAFVNVLLKSSQIS